MYKLKNRSLKCAFLVEYETQLSSVSPSLILYYTSPGLVRLTHSPKFSVDILTDNSATMTLSYPDWNNKVFGFHFKICAFINCKNICSFTNIATTSFNHLMPTLMLAVYTLANDFNLMVSFEKMVI